MANTIHVDVVSAEALIFSGEAEFVALPGEAGELGIYPRHTPLITRIRPGAVRIKVAGRADDSAALEVVVFIRERYCIFRSWVGTRRDGAAPTP